MTELTVRKEIAGTPSAKGNTKEPTQKTSPHTTSIGAEEEIEVICTIIRNGYHLGLSSRNRLSPRERFQFAVKLEEVCAIAEWMSRYVGHQEGTGSSEGKLELR